MTTESPLAPLIRKFECHLTLSADDRAAILALPFTLRTLDPPSYLVREGDRPDQCIVLISGFAFRQKVTSEGGRQILSIHIPGDALDFQNLFLTVADHSVQILTPATVAVVPRSAILELIRTRPSMAQAVLLYTSIEASILREWVLNIGRRDARTRLAHLLCEFALRLDVQGLAEGEGYELPMTQEHLADALGLTSVHVNRTLKVLESEGLVMRVKRHVSFPQWHSLRDIADFNSRYLHLDQQLLA